MKKLVVVALTVAICSLMMVSNASAGLFCKHRCTPCVVQSECKVMKPIYEEAEGTRTVWELQKETKTIEVTVDRGSWEYYESCATYRTGCLFHHSCCTVPVICKRWVPNLVKEPREVTCWNRVAVEKPYKYKKIVGYEEVVVPCYKKCCFRYCTPCMTPCVPVDCGCN